MINKPNAADWVLINRVYAIYGASNYPSALLRYHPNGSHNNHLKYEATVQEVLGRNECKVELGGIWHPDAVRLNRSLTFPVTAVPGVVSGNPAQIRCDVSAVGSHYLLANGDPAFTTPDQIIGAGNNQHAIHKISIFPCYLRGGNNGVLIGNMEWQPVTRTAGVWNANGAIQTSSWSWPDP